MFNANFQIYKNGELCNEYNQSALLLKEFIIERIKSTDIYFDDKENPLHLRTVNKIEILSTNELEISFDVFTPVIFNSINKNTNINQLSLILDGVCLFDDSYQNIYEIHMNLYDLQIENIKIKDINVNTETHIRFKTNNEFKKEKLKKLFLSNIIISNKKN